MRWLRYASRQTGLGVVEAAVSIVEEPWTIIQIR